VTSATALHLDSVSLTYRSRGQGEVTALEEMNLDVSDNEFITIVGQSGCGKSTLLRLVSGLLAPTTGNIELAGRPVIGPRSDVGIVFQSAVLLPWRTVLENVLLPIEFLKLDTRKYEARARELLALVGLKGFESAYPRALSGGMQQRVSISRALVSDPRILLMDEPFGALDAMTREELSFELLRIWDERKKTVLFVTHSIPEAVLLANRVVVMTPRPARVAKIIEVNLPRPRTLEMEFSDEFRKSTDEIRELIYQKSPKP
jgi:NitT/TauT family transport system ATP-binding protein